VWLADPKVQQQLLVLEEQEGAVNFKIGVLLAMPGQTTDNEMFSNGAPRRAAVHAGAGIRLLPLRAALLPGIRVGHARFRGIL
jgi:hypothetical protein